MYNENEQNSFEWCSLIQFSKEEEELKSAHMVFVYRSPDKPLTKLCFPTLLLSNYYILSQIRNFKKNLESCMVLSNRMRREGVVN